VVLVLDNETLEPTHTEEGPLMVPGSVSAYTVFTLVAVIDPQPFVTV
jgi:hypothetical protein